MYFIFGNYGDNTIAVIQWAHNKNLKNVTVVHVETGWGAQSWENRTIQGIKLVNQYGFKSISLKPQQNFSALVRDRQSFPNAKYQWCSTFLKALPFLSWLDKVDSRAEGNIILGSRREDSRARNNLPEFIEESEHYGDRKVWYPLFNVSIQERDNLIVQAGFEVLNRRSFECHPCIHSSLKDLQTLDEKNIFHISILEQELKQYMFQSRFPNKRIEILNVEENKTEETKTLELFDMGCGSHYACGE